MFDKANDDGSLACLGIPRDATNKSFHCKETTQSQLVNTSFWVIDFVEGVETRISRLKGGRGQTLVLIARERTAREEDMQKFFTGSAEILYILQKVRELDAFPRRVTLKAQGNRYYFI